ncbi:MAG: hypothetical protein A4E62_01812 [Syntrophorhabdus sp. PtaU1.Bin002]|nr:MAG: hypothetical protein A4E62_01812 [Syntrophorhabdus sp. PtaU1.Bin002]
MEPAHDMDFIDAGRYRVFHPLLNLIQGEHVAAIIRLIARKGTQGATQLADVGVVHVHIDTVVCDVAVESASNELGYSAQVQDACGGEHGAGIHLIDRDILFYLFCDGAKGSVLNGISKFHWHPTYSQQNPEFSRNLPAHCVLLDSCSEIV